VLRVIQCSLGNVGTLNLPILLDRRDLELVGVWCHSPEKAGTDVGELMGRDAVGVRVTGDFDEVVALDADCVLYHSRILGRQDDALAQIARLLRSGKNVVVPWISALQWPEYGRVVDARAVKVVEAACRDGASSLLMTGTDPGFFSDMLPAVLTGVCDRVDSLRVQEVLDYSSFDDERLTAPDFFCFGQPLDHDEPNFVDEVTIVQGWGATPALVAAAVGVEVVSVEHFERRAPAVERVPLGRAGTVEPGTIAARWFGIACTTTGPTITWEHVTHVSPASVPAGWPVRRPLADGYAVRIEGSPTIDLRCDVTEHGNPFWGAYLVTATRCTNALHAVAAAAPGIVTILDLPLGSLTRRAG
jgi:hypothetical protein